MALSDKRILEEKRRGNIVISPFKRRNLSTSSYDVTLGKYFFREQHPSKKKHHHIFDIYSKKHTAEVWGTKALFAKKAREEFKVSGGQVEDFEGIFPNDYVIVLEPGETILAHTKEFIGGKNTITTMMKAKSSFGRVFISVCKCAGWGDVGYINRWTMEITNNSPHHVIPIVVGKRIAQIVFFETGSILGKDYSETGAYQSQSDIILVKKNWKPEMMLPRLWKDVQKKK